VRPPGRLIMRRIKKGKEIATPSRLRNVYLKSDFISPNASNQADISRTETFSKVF